MEVNTWLGWNSLWLRGLGQQRKQNYPSYKAHILLLPNKAKRSEIPEGIFGASTSTATGGGMLPAGARSACRRWKFMEDLVEAPLYGGLLMDREREWRAISWTWRTLLTHIET